MIKLSPSMIKLEDLSMKIIEKNKNVNPIREKNQENLSKIQRLNLELKSLDEEKDRVNDEIQSIRKALGVIDDDIVREKSIIIDANSNEKRLREEKENLITVDSKYYETEKLSGLDLVNAKGKLKDEQDKLERILENLNLDTLKKNSETIDLASEQLDKAKEMLIREQYQWCN